MLPGVRAWDHAFVPCTPYSSPSTSACRGFDDVLGDSHGAPHPLAIRRVNEDAGCCGRGAVLVEDADLVVGEVDLFQLGIVRPDSFPQCLIEGVYRTVALCGGDDPLPAYGELYGRLRHRL